MASPEDIAELETVEEAAEVLRRLGTGEKAGLSGEEAARRLRVHGPNVVSRSTTCAVANHQAVHGGFDFALAKDGGWVRAGLIWLYNFVVLTIPVLMYHRWTGAQT